MRRFVACFSLLSFLTVLLGAPPAMAAADKELQNIRGSVTYGATGTEQQVANRATAVIQDNDTAKTGSNSQAGINLPDSSQILLGANTTVRVDQFNYTGIANASFTIVGKVRFSIRHPKGAKANYTFKTPTAQIAVRGTEGDISFDGNGNLSVNVYSLSDPDLPVQVTLSNGQVITLHAGESLSIGAGAAGIVQGAIHALSHADVQTFSEFGMPQNAIALGVAPAAATAGVFPFVTAIIVDTALLAATSHTTTSTIPGPNGTNVPVHIQITFPIIHFP